MPSFPPRITRFLLLTLLSLSIFALVLKFSILTSLWSEKLVIKPHQDSILYQELKSLDEQGVTLPQQASGSQHDFEAGTPIVGKTYSRRIIVPKTKHEDLSWLDEKLWNVSKAVYAVDDEHALLHPPKNKGNEVMVYLSYIIDHYENLADINIFIHSHRWAWHNNDLLDGDMFLMLRHLNDARVIREGYMNLRCQWYPGCPNWLRPDAQHEDMEKREEKYVAQAWREIFPGRPVPQVLGQPCCSQFAASKDSIRRISLAEYERIRKWVLETKIRDSMSGRIFEYLWQYLFTGQHTHCPGIHTCYCDGYGACFEDEDDFQSWFKTRFEIRKDEWEMHSWIENEIKYRNFVDQNRKEDAERVERAPDGRIDELKLSIQQRWIQLGLRRDQALERGRDPKVRAKIAGREWNEGDGY
ncbi:uncharacterized protein PV09_06334 [Verruconis gallopava]|uniref:Uncharacterized protein n=1 Tax=Verruconis gallopava TaxID=253628 RepID=A0A0D2A6H1_9PEZI|nr:uncharacterized protein PV09_06334 [Verruconis gallopava]KIW02170.1 hypothetical protein PV09_06334 [Verruconis gallopava]